MKRKKLRQGLHEALLLIARLSVAGDHLRGKQTKDALQRWRDFHPEVRDILNKYPDLYPGFREEKKA